MSPAARASTRIWRRLDTPGLEWCRFGRTSLQGDLLAVLDGVPCCVRYVVQRDGGWRTLGATVAVEDRTGLRRLTLRSTASGRWLLGRKELPWARGLLDVDLGVTPSTNTLPIRRLRLAVGESAELTAVWVRFPDLAVRPLTQRYTRLGLSTYRYQSLVGGKVRFSARIDVDRGGAVERYAGLFQRVE